MSNPTLRLDSINGGPVVEYRITVAGVERRARLPNGRVPRDGGTWEPQSMQRLRQMPAGTPVWDWLREHGYRRPSPSGPSGIPQSADAKRAAGRVQLATWLSTAAAARLDELAAEWGVTKREALERLLCGCCDTEAEMMVHIREHDAAGHHVRRSLLLSDEEREVEAFDHSMSVNNERS